MRPTVPSLRPRPLDLLAPGVVLAIGLAELVSFAGTAWWGAGLLEGVACAALVWRRPLAIPAAVLAVTAASLLPLFGPRMQDVSAPILIGVLAAWSTARWVRGYWGLVGVAGIVLALALEYLLLDTRQHGFSDVVFVTALLAPPYVFGRLARRLAVTTEQLREQQELVRRQAVHEERDRIARELHDVIAHSISAMVVQTAAAQDLVRTDPDRVAGILERVASTGRRALSETGRLLHVIRDSDDELGLAPTPGMADLEALVEQFRRDGLDVRLEVSGSLAEVPAGIDVSAYRIVQEALTNALRYAEDGAVLVQVTGSSGDVRIRTSNRASGRTGVGSGLGLMGVAERVAVLGGSVRHGPTPSGHFELDVSLPVAEASS